MKPTLSFIESLALGAGEILREYSGQNLKITPKGEIDLVTEADGAALVMLSRRAG